MDLGYSAPDYGSPAVASPSKTQKMKKVYPCFEVGSRYDDRQSAVNLPITAADINKPIKVSAILIPKEIGSSAGDKGTKRNYRFEIKDIVFHSKPNEYSEVKSKRHNSMVKGLNSGGY